MAAETASEDPEFELVRRIGQGTFAQVFEARLVPKRVDDEHDVGHNDAKDDDDDAESAGVKGDEGIGAVKSAEAEDGLKGDAQPASSVAVKKIRQDDGRGPGHSARTLTKREVDFLRRLDHPNVIKLLQVYVKKGSTHLVFPLCRWDLEMVLADTGVPLVLADIKCYAQGLLRALAHCHAQGLLHRDVKPNNLLVGGDGFIKLCDFGSAREIQTEAGKLTHQVVTQNYRSPELIFGLDPYTDKIDVWAAACVIGEMLRRRVLFEGRSDIDQLVKIFAVTGSPTDDTWPTAQTLPFFFPFQPASAKDLVSVLFTRDDAALDLGASLEHVKQQTAAFVGGMLRLDPARRVTARDAAEDPFFASDPPPTAVTALPRPSTRGMGGNNNSLQSSDGSLSSSSISSWGG